MKKHRIAAVDIDLAKYESRRTGINANRAARPFFDL